MKRPRAYGWTLQSVLVISLLGLLFKKTNIGLAGIKRSGVALSSRLLNQLAKLLLLMLGFYLGDFIDDELSSPLLFGKKHFFFLPQLFLSVFVFKAIFRRLSSLGKLTWSQHTPRLAGESSFENVFQVQLVSNQLDVLFEDSPDFFFVVFEPVEVSEGVSRGDELQQGLEQVCKELPLLLVQLLLHLFIWDLLLDFVDLESPKQSSVSSLCYFLAL